MAAVLPAEPHTVGQVILLGWMPRDIAVRHLTTECIDPRFDEASASAAWEDYHRRVEEIPERNCAAPERLQLSTAEATEAAAFMKRHQQSPNVKDVIKIDPWKCVAHQLMVITDRAETYGTADSPQTKIRYCLGLHQQLNVQLQILPVPFGVRVPIPHAEFAFGFENGFKIQQLAPHISVTAFDNRLLLSAGYHRSFALSALHNPDAIERSLVVVLTTDGDFILSQDSPNQAVREMARSLRPPLFADFFDERLAMRIRVRKRRCELWVQGQIKWFDDGA